MNISQPRQSILALTLLILLTLSSALQAAEPQFWPYDRLTGKADLVVIGVPRASQDSGELVYSPLWQLDFVGVNTTVEVRGVVDGRFRARELTLFHLRLPDGKTLQNGPRILNFPNNSFSFGTAAKGEVLSKPEYLLFLKKRDDGRYEPVSGTLDAGQSVRELYPLPSQP